MAFRPAAAAWRVVGNGLSPICSSMTSLPAAFRRLATAKTSNAVSPVSPRAKLLMAGGMVGCHRTERTATRRRAGRAVLDRIQGSRTDDDGRLTGVERSLLGRDGLGQRPDHGRDNVAVDQFLTLAALVAVRLAKVLVGRAS